MALLCGRLACISSGFYIGMRCMNQSSLKCEYDQVARQNMVGKWNLDTLIRPDIIVSVSLAMMPYGLYWIWRYQVRQRFMTKDFSNIINISLNGIGRLNSRGKYAFYWRSIIENDIEKIMINPTGVMELQKAAKNTSISSPFIKPTNMATYKTNCNIISNQINQLCVNQWITRIGYNDNPKAIASEMFIYGIMGSQGQPKEILTLKKIFVILLKETVIKQVINDWGSKIHTMSAEEWNNKLEDYEMHHYHVRHRWMLIREIIKQYDDQIKDKIDGGIIWGEPLCDIELAFPYLEELAKAEGIEPKDPSKVQPFNSWYRHCQEVVASQEQFKAY